MCGGGQVLKTTVLVAIVLLFAASCSSASTGDAAQGAEPAETAAVASGRDSNKPLWSSKPGLAVRVDGERLTWLAMVWETWDGMAVEPMESHPTGAVVAPTGETLELVVVEDADLVVTLYRLSDESIFEPVGEPITAAGTSIDITADEPGLMFVKVEAAFGESPNYAGSGRLQYHGLIHVAPPGAACVGQGPSKVEVGTFSGLFDNDGCPALVGEARLNWWAMLPEFHCAPWPASLEVPEHPSTWSTFLRTDFPESEISRTRLNTLPKDAIELGFELPAGPVLISESEPDSVFVDLGDGTAEQWLPDVDGWACA